MIMIIIDVVYCWRALTLLPPPKKFFWSEIVACCRRGDTFCDLRSRGALQICHCELVPLTCFLGRFTNHIWGLIYFLQLFRIFFLQLDLFVWNIFFKHIYMQAKSSVSSICLLLKTAHNIYSAQPYLLYDFYSKAGRHHNRCGGNFGNRHRQVTTPQCPRS